MGDLGPFSEFNQYQHNWAWEIHFAAHFRVNKSTFASGFAREKNLHPNHKTFPPINKYPYLSLTQEVDPNLQN